mmetsp:Transcript_10988/g.36449  ORF Transcript_10988/g.36449 Transcript_10988/m.36449 type:complete len:242 (+) Transcript_10988:1155-1880(+)|eukprot:scaffold9729_cov108-Isochrysis_galbana.AAC.11
MHSFHISAGGGQQKGDAGGIGAKRVDPDRQGRRRLVRRRPLGHPGSTEGGLQFGEQPLGQAVPHGQGGQRWQCRLGRHELAGVAPARQVAQHPVDELADVWPPLQRHGLVDSGMVGGAQLEHLKGADAQGGKRRIVHFVQPRSQLGQRIVQQSLVAQHAVDELGGQARVHSRKVALLQRAVEDSPGESAVPGAAEQDLMRDIAAARGPARADGEAAAGAEAQQKQHRRPCWRCCPWHRSRA